MKVYHIKYIKVYSCCGMAVLPLTCSQVWPWDKIKRCEVTLLRINQYPKCC